jgi:hypothetical protein
MPKNQQAQAPSADGGGNIPISDTITGIRQKIEMPGKITVPKATRP